jgi:flagellin
MPILDGTLSARVYADHVDRISATDAVKAGMYQVEVTKAATQAKISSTTAIDPNNSTTQVGVSGTVDINGSKVEISEDDTYAQVYEKLRNAAEVGGATLEINNGAMTVTSEAYGHKGVVAMSFTDANLVTKLGFDPTTTAKLNQDTGLYEVAPSIGTEPEIKLVRDTADSAFSNTATIATDGNRVTITDSGDFRMSFLFSGTSFTSTIQSTPNR